MKTLMCVATLVGMTGLAAAQPAKPAEVPKMADRKPPAELAAQAKLAGAWKCTGQGMDPAAMKMAPMAGTMHLKATLGGWWIHSTFDSNTGKDKFMLETYTTYDASTKKWKRLMMDNSGAWTRGESDGPKSGKTDWDMTSYTPMGEIKFRDHEETTAGGVKMWGEISPDNGASWTKVYEMTCKK